MCLILTDFWLIVFRAIAPGVLDKDLFRIQTLQHIMKMTRTWDSTMSMIPKGGETIWGGLDWSPEEGYAVSKRKQNTNQSENSVPPEDGNVEPKAKHAHYGRIISFGKDVAEADASEIQRIEFRVTFLAFFMIIVDNGTYHFSLFQRYFMMPFLSISCYFFFFFFWN